MTVRDGKRRFASFIQTLRNGCLIVFVLAALVGGQGMGVRAAPDTPAAPAAPNATIGGVDLGDLTNYLVFVADGSGKAKIQSASDGYAGDWAVNGTVATEETSGSFGYAGTIYTNDTGAAAFEGWQDILDNNVGQAFGSTGNTALINSLKTTLNNAFLTINALPATAGYTSVSAASLNGLNTTDGVATTYVINVTSFSSTPMRITGDPGDIFIMRWDTDANFSNGYQGQVKFSGGDGIVPLGGLSPANFIHVAGDLNSSGGGSPPTDFNFPLGPRTGNGQGPLPTGASNWPGSQGGGFFTGYWLTTGSPDNAPDANHSVRWGSSSSTSNGRFVGGWYSLTDNFTWTSGTSGVYIGPLDYGDLPEPKYLTTRKTSGQSGPAHVITSKLYMGTVFAGDIDSEGNGQPNATATGDNIVNVNDEQAVTFPTFLAGQSANVTVKATNSTGKTATLYGFIDWNSDGDFADTGESATVSVPNGTAGNVVLTFNVPAGANTAAQLGARFRLSTAGGLTPTDSPGANGPIPAPDGEVEDYLVSVSQPKDYGDAPDASAGTAQGNYNTTAGDNGPSHAIVANLKLGTAAPDADAGTLQNSTATADDLDNTDDEDGVSSLPTVTTTSTSVPLTVSVLNNTGSSATVACWVDFNRDGDFLDTGERASATVSNSGIQQNINLTFTGFAAPTGGTSYLRCRLANAAGEVTNPTGAANTGEVEDYLITIQPLKAQIGNFVWLDEDGDGYQDAGEAGIPNITVELWDSTHTTKLATRVTDANGGYLFTDLAAGTYQVDVLNSSLPSGLLQTTIPAGGGDFVNHADPYTLSVGAGEENLTADFGYNWAPNPPGNTGNGTIGDRVWVDIDGDGSQDPNEVGIPGVTVLLRYDSNNDGGIDAIWPVNTGNGPGIAVTDANGNYIFDELPVGIYEVSIPTPPAGTQTGDPDHFGTTGPNDNKTTSPVVLGPGDVFLNADFGYQPAANTTGVIGDRVWFDADADGVQDGGEAGIPGVTVALLKDSNGNGVWDSGEPIIGTDTTDGNGIYGFSGLPITDGAGTDDYLVWVNDTDSVLPPLTPTFDYDGLGNPASGVVSGAHIAAVTNLDIPANTLADTDVDFGYTAPGQTPGKGLIGDYVYIDRNGDGVYDADGVDNVLGTGDDESGIEGVIVELYDSTGTILQATTRTNENGYYYFGNLDPATYVVKITNSANFTPGGALNGMAYSDDPDAGAPDGLSAGVPINGNINLDQDFGLKATATPGTVGDLVWNDVNADGVYDADGLDNIAGNGDDEKGFAGVTLDLYRDLNGNGRLDAGEPKIGSATTDANGGYLFTGLSTTDNGTGPAGADYLVDVTDSAGVLNGYWHSRGTTGVNNNSQLDPYALSISAGAPNNLTGDFGYYVKPAAIGDLVWYDLDGDGLQDGGEPGIPNVPVVLTIQYPNGATTVVKTTTNANGLYSFGNLLQDENYNGSTADGTTEPVYTVTVATPTGFSPSPSNVGGAANDAIDSDGSGVVATVSPGLTDNTYDFGFVAPPPTYQITKRLNTHDPLRSGENISFTIRITNTGSVVMTTVPLTDTYDTTYLTFVGSLPPSDDNLNDGVLNWSDLTGLPAGFGIDLAPNQSFQIVVTFVGIADTTQLPAMTPCTEPGNTCNVASVSGAKYDPDGSGGVPEQGPLPPQSAHDDVQIIVPTAVALAEAGVTYADAQARLHWRTVNESGLLGFFLYRSADGAAPERVDEEMIPAQKPGQSDGAAYSYTDRAVQAGKRYSYAVEFVGTDGPLGWGVIGDLFTGARLFLPTVGK